MASERRIRWIPWALLILTLIAWGIRLYRLDAQSLWYDEGVTAQVVRQGLAELTRWTADDIQPPLYYYVVAGWVRLAGASEWSLRFPSVAWGVLTIPLIYALGCRLIGRRAGALAALLATTNPLYVYYSQEARMYTQLTALGLVVAYALLRALQSSDAPTRRRWWGTFAIASLAAVYTHYFAFFLLAAFAIAVGILLLLRPSRLTPSARRPSPLVPEAILAAGVILIGYLPWLPFVLNRYRVDASYWQGQLKLGEALRHTWINFVLGAPQTMLEPEALRAGWGFAAITVLALIGVLRCHRRKAWALSYLLCYLLVPVVLILILSSRTPKFNPRYLMLSSPALWLLIATGLDALLRPTVSRTPGSNLLAGVALAALVFILAAFAYADRSWFTDTRLTKADFRGAALYVRAHIAQDETVLLVSGHMSPVWDYYAGDLERVRLPDIDVLDVNAVLSYEVGNRLAQALAGKRGAWLILWQDEVADPSGVVADILEAAGAELPVDRSFWHVGVRHFRWAPDARFEGEPPIAYPAHVNFGGKVWLLGHRQRDDGELHLYWEAQAPLGEDLKVAGELLDAAGHVWGRLPDRRLSAYEYPTFRWRPGQVTLGRYKLPADPGTPPGEYRLRLRVYPEGGPPLEVLDVSGAPQGLSTFLTPIRVPRLVRGVSSETLEFARPLAMPMAPGLILLGVGDVPEEIIPGDAFTLETWWQATSELPPGLALQLWWQRDDTRFAPSDGPLTGDVPYPTEAWPTGMPVRGQHTVWAPREAPGGDLTLYSRVIDGRGEPLGNALALGQVRITPVEHRFEAPPVRWPSEAIFGGQVRLIGVDANPPQAAPGGTLAVTVVWQAVTAMDRSYTAFVHLLDRNGRVVAQEDHVPGRDARPTTSWLPNEVIVDRFDLTLPADLPPGRYTLEIGLYDANQPGFPRLSLDIGGDAVRLGEIVVSGK